MLEPVKLGFPLALFYAALLYAQLYLQLVDLTIFRWLLAGVSLGVVSDRYYAARSLGAFSFRDSWFAGFTFGIASNLVFVMLLLVFQSIFIKYLNMGDGSSYYQLIFIEFLSQLTFGIVTHSIFTVIHFLFKKKTKT